MLACEISKLQYKREQKKTKISVSMSRIPQKYKKFSMKSKGIL